MTIKRVLDANLNRSCEGLRVLEEYARFLLEREDLTKGFKILRHQLRALDKNYLIDRDQKDVGFTISSETDLDQRTALTQVLLANGNRVAEALRVLEEYGKLLDYRLGKTFEQMRFRHYSLHQELMKTRYVRGLYAITRPGREEEIVGQVDKWIQLGIPWIQYRDKKRTPEEVLTIARQLSRRMKGTKSQLIINDYPHIAQEVGAAGVHLGQDDLAVEEVRKQYPDLLIGLSVHNEDQGRAGLMLEPDYMAIGPIFHTESKENPEACEGLSLVKRLRDQAQIPLVAIGGINLSNLDQVMATRVDGIAMIQGAYHEDGLIKILELIGGRYV